MYASHVSPAPAPPRAEKPVGVEKPVVADPGTSFTVFKVPSYKVTINAPVGTNFYTGSGDAKTKIEIAAVDIGVNIDFTAYDDVGWRIKVTGTATIT